MKTLLALTAPFALCGTEAARARPRSRSGALSAALVAPCALGVWCALVAAGAAWGQAREIRVELEAAVPVQPPEDAGRAAEAPRSRALDAGLAEALRDVLRARLAEAEGQPGTEEPGAETAATAEPAASATEVTAATEATEATAATEVEPGDLGEPGEPAPDDEEAPDLLDMLPGDPSDYVLRYRVLEIIGERPAAPGDAASGGTATPEGAASEATAATKQRPRSAGRDGPWTWDGSGDGEAGEDGAPALEFALRLEVVLDSGRIQEALQAAGFAPLPGEQAGASLRIAVERPPSWRLLTRFRRALLDAGASLAVPLELAPQRALLLVEGANSARLEAALAGAASSPELSVAVLEGGPELVRVTLSAPALAPEADPEALGAPGAEAGAPPGGEEN